MATSFATTRPKRREASTREAGADEVSTPHERGKKMLEYKGYTIRKRKAMNNVDVYEALVNSHHALVSNQSLAVIVARIDEEEEKAGK